ncbi:MAG: flagellar export protein FliJ [Ignavibacteriales bacterium]
MKAFEFRLQTKLDLTIQQEEVAKEEVRKRQAVYDTEYDLLSTMLDLMAELHDRLRAKKGQSLKVDEVIVLNNFIKVLKTNIENQEMVVSEAERALELSRETLLQIMKERKTLEKLKENEYKEYMLEFMRLEQVVIDELAIGRHKRNEANKSE